MYISPFYITNPVGNNAFSFDKRENKKLYVPSLIKASSFDEIRLGEEVVFEDFDFDDNLQSCYGLQNFYEFDYNGIPLYLFDNHNHAYYFWHKSKKEGLIKDNSIIYHIDEHADTRDPWIYLEKEKLDNIQNIFDYTNFTLNVGNYIIPAIHDGLVKEVVQIRSEVELNNVREKIESIKMCVISSKAEKSVKEINNKIGKNNVAKSPLTLFTKEGKEQIPPLQSEGQDKTKTQNIILNLDLDFFQPDLDFIDYNLKKEVILKIASKASLITVATSPFFINQKLALEIFKDIFS